MICASCQELKPIENRDLGLCASCNKARRDQETDGLYPEVRRLYLKRMEALEEICPITGTPITMDSDIHHKMGRVGYADQWARDNDIELLIDPRFFLAVSRKGHTWIELHPNQARMMKYSLERSEIIKP